MKPITTSAELKAAIADLERKKDLQQQTIKSQIQETKKALNPVHLVKNTFSSLAEIPEIKRTFISTLIGIGIGYFSNKAAQFLKEDKLDRMVNNFVDRGIDKVKHKNPNGFLSKAISLTTQLVKDNK